MRRGDIEYIEEERGNEVFKVAPLHEVYTYRSLQGKYNSTDGMCKWTKEIGNRHQDGI